MLGQVAETYRRLIWIEIQANQVALVSEDLSAMEASIKQIKNPTRREGVTSGLDELRVAFGNRNIDPGSKTTSAAADNPT
jgi:hypothetical protein